MACASRLISFFLQRNQQHCDIVHTIESVNVLFPSLPRVTNYLSQCPAVSEHNSDTINPIDLKLLYKVARSYPGVWS
jgi:hypothetical protein